MRAANGERTATNGQQRPVNASDLAEMCRCERRVVLAHRYGQRRSAREEAARRRGLVAHEQFERQGRVVMQNGQGRRGRCFIATMVFGEGWQTQALRDFRDTVLRPRPWGRLLVLSYYRLGPAMCGVLRACPPVRWLVRWALRGAARMWRWCRA